MARVFWLSDKAWRGSSRTCRTANRANLVSTTGG